jgi:hypothetical protein
MIQTRNREYKLTFNTGDTSASFKAELPFRGFNIFCGDRKDGRFIFDTGPNPGFISNILIVLLTSPCTRPFTLLVQGVEKIS